MPAAVGGGTRIGVDVGTVRVGVAASDPDGILATPVATLARDESPARADQHEIARLCRAGETAYLVVGLPLTLSGAAGEAARLARDYARELAALVAPVRVRLVDERLTTVQSHRQLREGGVRNSRGHRAVVDQAAAVLLLQSALDAERATGRQPGQPVTGGRKPRTKERG